MVGEGYVDPASYSPALGLIRNGLHFHAQGRIPVNGGVRR